MPDVAAPVSRGSVTPPPWRAAPASTAVAVVTVAATCVGAGLWGARELDGPLSRHVLESVVLALTWSVLGLLLRRRVGGPLGTVLLTVGASEAVALLAGELSSTGVVRSAAAGWLAGWCWLPGLVLPLTVVPLVFPSGRAHGRLERRALAAAWALTAVTCVAAATTPSIGVRPGTSVQNPLALPGADAVLAAALACLLLLALLAQVRLVVRTARAEVERRRQLVPFVLASLLAALTLSVEGFLPGEWGPALQLAVLPLLPVATAVCVLRYRLYDVELVVRRGVLLLGLGAVVLGAYVVCVEMTLSLLGPRAGRVGAAVGAGVAAALFAPARAALQRTISRRLYGLRDDPYEALAALGSLLAVTATPGAAASQLLEQLRLALRLPWAAVATEHGDELVAQCGTLPSWAQGPVRLPLVHVGEPQGALLVVPRTPREGLTAADRQVLADVCVPLASAVAADRHLAELQREREAVVLAREEERRRLRHDLHDVLGADLAAVATQLDLLELRLRNRPEAAAALLPLLRGTVGGALLDVRRVVEGLRPPSLDDLGLVSALEQAAVSASTETTTVRVHAPRDLPALSAAAETAAFRIAVEAFTNAIRHAEAQHVTVGLDADEDGQWLVVQVDDDGSGVAADAPAGVGSESMRWRAQEIGGSVLLTSSASGTSLRARLPAGSP